MNPKQRQTKRWVLSEVEQWVNERAREDDYE
jgi:predicted DNA-binding transcriptional regulator AlpA